RKQETQVAKRHAAARDPVPEAFAEHERDPDDRAHLEPAERRSFGSQLRYEPNRARAEHAERQREHHSRRAKNASPFGPDLDPPSSPSHLAGGRAQTEIGAALGAVLC